MNKLYSVKQLNQLVYLQNGHFLMGEAPHAELIQNQIRATVVHGETRRGLHKNISLLLIRK